MEVVLIGNNAQLIRSFHAVGERIYENDLHYIKPIQSDVEAVFNPQKNNSFKKGEAVRFLLLGDDNRTAVGRIAAFYQDKAGKRRGAWGFFECENNVSYAQALIESAEKWLKVMGCVSAQAPVNFGSRDQFWGLWISGSRRPSYQENYHPGYYRDLIENAGYALEIEQTTYEIDRENFQMERFKKIAARTFGNEAYEYRILDFSRIDSFAMDFVEVYNQAWAFHDDFEPLDLNTIQKQFRKMKAAMLPELGVFAYHENRPIGFFISILELNEVFRDFDGQLGLWNKVLFLLRRNRIQTARGIVFGIAPKYQNKGIEAGLIMKSHDALTKISRFKRMELSWIGDFNPKMLSMLNALGAQLIKTHHTYLKFFS
jgi:hypothetical protein